MKHLFLILTLFLIVFQESVYSQEYCSTSNFNLNSSDLITSSNISAPLTLRVYFHVVRKDDKTGGYSPDEVESALGVLQGDFNPHGIFFAWDGCIDYINDDDYFNASIDERAVLSGLYSIDNHPDGIDVYLNPSSNANKGGEAHGFGEGTELWVSGTWDDMQVALTSVLSHEMGHVLFLFHTHHGCEGGTWENLDEMNPNCTTAGDQVCDTPRDPNMHFNLEDCVWDGTNAGCQNPNDPPQDLGSYNPDPHNIMSYTRPGCMTGFTEGQGIRMINKIGKSQSLEDCIVTGTIEHDFCKCLPDDIIITENSVIDYDVHIPGNLIILNGAELTIQNTVYFNNGYGIKIQENSKLILDGATLGSCENNWKGIRVINGELEANDSYILNAKKGIKARSGTTLNLENVEIIGNSGLIGVYLQGAVNLDAFKNMKIEDYFFGIYGVGGTGFYDFDKGEIINTHYGIFLRRSVAYIQNYEITAASRFGVFMNACDNSFILDSRIGYSDYGIFVKNTTNIDIDNTTIGYDSQIGRTAVSLLNCRNMNIIGNTNAHIRATKYGVRAFQSNVTISENNIDVQGQSNTAGGGIQLTNGAGSMISRNFITTNNLPFGIESVDGQSNSISHNDISVTTTIAKNAAVIRTMGGMTESIDNNIIDGHGTIAGIIAQNSTANTYDCNDISNTVEGLAILNNAEGQDIKGNEFLSSIIDLTIQSVIGLQIYTGNEFVNGSARAIGLDEQGIEDSRFFVNETITINGINANHMPSDPNPGNGQWFVNDTNEDDYYDECGSPGPFVKFHDDEEKLADYFEKVKLLQNEQPNVFYTKLYDLLKYEQEKVDYTLPNNIKQDAVFTNLCGLEELVNMSSQLNDLLLSNNNMEGDYQTIRVLQNEYVLATEAADRAGILSNLNQSLALLAPAMENQLIADSMALLDIKTNLENISCTSAYVEKWKDIYTIYIEYIQTGEIAEKQQKALIEYSKKCSDQYGDAIHIARALANTFDDTYFDVYDDCLEENKIKSLQITDNSLHAFIQPNPSKGTIVLHTEDEVTGTIKVIDLTGRLVHTTTMTDAYQHTLNLDLNGGIYYIYLTTSTGAVFVEKIVITK